MIDPNDKRTLDLVEMASGRPARPLAELIEASALAAAPEDDDEADSGPLDPAARQRRMRARRKALGKKAVWLTDVERLAIQCALELLHAIPAPGLAATLDAALQAVTPGAIWPESDAPAARAEGGQLERLRARVADLEQENELCIVERGRAFEAVKVLQARLQRAGLPTDYQRQPGEPK